RALPVARRLERGLAPERAWRGAAGGRGADLRRGRNGRAAPALPLRRRGGGGGVMRRSRLFSPRPSERGAALLATIFIVAIMAAAAAAVTEEIRYAVRRAQNVEARDQAYWYALGAETLAR